MVKKNNLYIIVWIFLIQSCVSENREIVRDENGNIILKCELKNGVRHGKCIDYYPNGTVKGVSNWVAGIMDGKQIVYFENGNVKSTGMWKDDKIDGEHVWYYETGVIECKIFFIKGQGKGHELYDEEGNLQEIR